MPQVQSDLAGTTIQFKPGTFTVALLPQLTTKDRGALAEASDWPGGPATVRWDGAAWGKLVPAVGASSVFQASVTIPLSYQWATVNYVDAAVSAASKIVCSFQGQADSTQNDAEETAEWDVSARPKTGSVDFFIRTPGPFSGPAVINYMIGA